MIRSKSYKILFFIMVFARMFLIAGTWNQLSSGTQSELVDIQFVSNTVGWIVGGSTSDEENPGIILHTVDGGQTWIQQNIDTEFSIRGSYFFNETIGWIVGYSGSLFKTVDGGQTWNRLESNHTNTLFDTYFFNENTGFIIGARGIIIKTTDGGNTWTVPQNPLYLKKLKLRSIDFCNADTGFVVGHDRWILRTTDGGETWFQLHSVDVDKDLRFVQFVNDSTGWAIGEKGQIIHTQDCGNSWVEQQTGTIRDLWGGFFLNDKVGYAVGDSGTVLCTVDGGETWEFQETNSASNLMSMDFRASSLGWCVGTIGEILESPEPGSPRILNLDIQNQNQLRITFTEAPYAETYNIYRDISSNVETISSNLIAENITDQDSSLPFLQWLDNSPAINDVNLNYYYVVKGNGKGIGTPSNVQGEYEYLLTTTSSTDFNLISIPLVQSTIETSQDLLNLISSCNSVATWYVLSQSYEQFLPIIPSTSFQVTNGGSYLINVVSDTIITFLGEIVNPSYDLLTTSTSNYNSIMIPLGYAGVSMASDLINDIPNCESVAAFNGNTQSYDQFVPNTPTPDYSVLPGKSYLVSVSQQCTWPSNAPAKQRISQNRQLMNQDKLSGSKAPHIVWGDVSQQKMDNFFAYLKRNPKDRLTDKSAGSMLTDEYWMLQCSNFKSRWHEGDTLIVELSNDRGFNQMLSTKLTYNVADYYGKVAEKQSEFMNRTPKEFTLSHNYPNPFNCTTKINYSLPEQGDVYITIYNLIGQVVYNSYVTNLTEGDHEFVWNGTNNDNQTIGGGIYIFQVRFGKVLYKEKMLYIP